MESTIIGYPYITIAEDLDGAGLCWRPEVGDEVSHRDNLSSISILVDPDGMSPKELRQTYLWLPTVEQLVSQIEARQAILFHAGLEMTTGLMAYKTVVQAQTGLIESVGESLRVSVGLALRDLLYRERRTTLH